MTSARPLCRLSGGGAVGTLRRLSNGGAFGAGALCRLSSGAFFSFPPTDTTLALRTCTGLSPVITAATDPTEGLRTRACGSSDARRGALPAPRLAIADPNALPSCDGAAGPGGDRARDGWAELRRVLGPDGVPDPGVPAGLGEAGDPVERIEAARCNRAEAEVVRLADGETFATRTVGLSGEMLPELPTADREDDTCSGDCERAGVFESERMDSVDGVLRRSVGCATSASETIEDVLTRAFSGAPVAADAMLELLSWRVTYAWSAPSHR